MVVNPTQWDGMQPAHLGNECQTRGTSGEATTFGPNDSDSDSILTVSSVDDDPELRPSVNKVHGRKETSGSQSTSTPTVPHPCFTRAWSFRNEVLAPGLLSGRVSTEAQTELFSCDIDGLEADKEQYETLNGELEDEVSSLQDQLTESQQKCERAVAERDQAFDAFQMLWERLGRLRQLNLGASGEDSQITDLAICVCEKVEELAQRTHEPMKPHHTVEHLTLDDGKQLQKEMKMRETVREEIGVDTTDGGNSFLASSAEQMRRLGVSMRRKI